MRPASERDLPGLAIVLAGGSGRRLGLVDKPELTVRGRSLLSLALDAVAPALTVVVGPPRDLPEEVLQVTEDPAHGGPAAALAAGLAALVTAPAEPGGSDLVAVLAADLPGIDAAAVRMLTAAVLEQQVDGAVLVDPAGRDQYLAGVWRADALLAAVARRHTWHCARLADLLAPLVGARVPADSATAADIDTTADLLKWDAALPVPPDAD